MRGLAKIARELGDGDIRLTVWQNLLISGIAEDERSSWSSAASRARPLLPRRRASAPASSPAPATRAASSPSSNTKDTAMAIADWSSRASRSTRRSTSTSRAARTPAPSTTSATSACSRAGRRVDASGDDTVEGFHILRRRRLRPGCRHRPRTLPRREGRGLPAGRRAHAQGLSGRSEPSDETFLAFTRRHEVAALAEHDRSGDCWKTRLTVQIVPADLRGDDPRRCAVLAGAAPLAQRLLRRPAVARCAAGATALNGAMPDAAAKALAAARTMARRGTMRPCPSPSA